MASSADLAQAIRSTMNVRPSSVSLDSPQLLNGQALLRRMSVDVRSADRIEARATQTLSQQVALPSSQLDIANLEPFTGPLSLLSHASASSTVLSQEPLQVQSPQVASAAGSPVSTGVNAVLVEPGEQEALQVHELVQSAPANDVEIHAPVVPEEAGQSGFEKLELPENNLSARLSARLPSLEKLLPDMAKTSSNQVANDVPSIVEPPPALDAMAHSVPELSARQSGAVIEGVSVEQLIPFNVQLETPHSLVGIIGEGVNTLSGASDALSAIPAVAGLDHTRFDAAVNSTGLVTLGLGWGLGAFALYQQTKQISLLEQHKRDIENSVQPKDAKPEEVNSDLSSSDKLSEVAQRSIRRLDDQIKQVTKERYLTAGAFGSAVALGGATVGLSQSGSLIAARATGTALAGVGIVLSTAGAVIDGLAAQRQRKVNAQLESSLAELKKAAPPPGALAESLTKVAEHAKTAGKSRERGKWFSMSMNVLNGLTGVAGIAFKFLMVGSAAATAGTVLLAAGGALALGAAAFGLYKWRQNVKLRNAANAELINLQSKPDLKDKHDALLKNNKYYALKQFVFDLQHNTSETLKATTLTYLGTALNLNIQQAEAFYAELKNPDTSVAATQHLADALFRGKAIVM